jgi:hypothetical protein
VYRASQTFSPKTSTPSRDARLYIVHGPFMIIFFGDNFSVPWMLKNAHGCCAGLPADGRPALVAFLLFYFIMY